MRADMSKPNSEHWCGVKRILRYVKGTPNHGLKFTGSNDDFDLVGYSDADWGGDLLTRKSTSGYLFQLGGSTVSWRSTRQSVVALSTTEAEYIALCGATQEAVWLRNLLASIDLKPSSPTLLYEDNQGAISLSKHPKDHGRTKHVDIKFHYTREAIMNNVVVVKYCPTSEMTADILTKGLAKPAFEKFCRYIGVVDLSQ